MPIFIYLDQNVLSDLRERKLSNSVGSALSFLKKALLDRDNEAVLVYSFSHLDEINQIPKQDYVGEHIELLRDLRAAYLMPGTNRLTFNDPAEVWAGYLENRVENDRMKLGDVSGVNDQMLRKLSGLNVGASFQELHGLSVQALNDLLSAIENHLAELEVDKEESPVLLDVLRTKLEELRQQVSSMPSLSLMDGKPLGPISFRDADQIKSLRLKELSPEDVIPEIDRIFSSLSGSFRWEDHFDGSDRDQIARCYSLMNWAGYFSDDFASHKKSKDRFRASQNDLMHAQNAAGAHYLISRDESFRKKAAACYLYLKIKTAVMSPENFSLNWATSGGLSC